MDIRVFDQFHPLPQNNKTEPQIVNMAYLQNALAALIDAAAAARDVVFH